MEIGDVIELEPGKFMRVDFINYARAYVVPLATEPKVIQVRNDEGELVDKTINRSTDGSGFNISPNSAVRVVPREELPPAIRKKLGGK